MKPKKILQTTGWVLLSIVALIVIYFVLTAIGPNGKSIIGHTETFTDTVVGIRDGGDTYDIIFSVKNNTRTFYINRGLENGLRMDSLRLQLINQGATFSYASPSSHINRLVCNGRVVYSELGD